MQRTDQRVSQYFMPYEESEEKWTASVSTGAPDNSGLGQLDKMLYVKCL